MATRGGTRSRRTRRAPSRDRWGKPLIAPPRTAVAVRFTLPPDLHTLLVWTARRHEMPVEGYLSEIPPDTLQRLTSNGGVVRDVMSAPATTVQESARVPEAARLMHERHLNELSPSGRLCLEPGQHAVGGVSQRRGAVRRELWFLALRRPRRVRLRRLEALLRLP